MSLLAPLITGGNYQTRELLSGERLSYERNMNKRENAGSDA